MGRRIKLRRRYDVDRSDVAQARPHESHQLRRRDSIDGPCNNAVHILLDNACYQPVDNTVGHGVDIVHAIVAEPLCVHFPDAYNVGPDVDADKHTVDIDVIAAICFGKCQ